MFNLEKYFCKHNFYEKSRHYEPSSFEKGLKIEPGFIRNDVLQSLSIGKTTIILCCEKCGIYKIYTQEGKSI